MQDTTVSTLPLGQLYALWDKLGDIPTVPPAGNEGDDDDSTLPVGAEGSIEEPFLHFPVGTHREDIWHWFEAQNPRFIVGDVMQGIRPPDYTLRVVEPS